jgi:hypothetical protein
LNGALIVSNNATITGSLTSGALTITNTGGLLLSINEMGLTSTNGGRFLQVWNEGGTLRTNIMAVVDDITGISSSTATGIAAAVVASTGATLFAAITVTNVNLAPYQLQSLPNTNNALPLKFRVGISPMSGLAFGSTNDALVVGVTGADAYWGEAQFNDTTEQRFRVTISPAATARWTGGALTNQIYWRGTSTVGAVVWRLGFVGATNNGLIDLAYENLTIGSNTVSGVTSNINVTTIIVTPTNTPAGSLWLGELRRLPGNASDTMVNDARMLNWTITE